MYTTLHRYDREEKASKVRRNELNKNKTKINYKIFPECRKRSHCFLKLIIGIRLCLLLLLFGNISSNVQIHVTFQYRYRLNLILNRKVSNYTD